MTKCRKECQVMWSSNTEVYKEKKYLKIRYYSHKQQYNKYSLDHQLQRPYVVQLYRDGTRVKKEKDCEL